MVARFTPCVSVFTVLLLCACETAHAVGAEDPGQPEIAEPASDGSHEHAAMVAEPAAAVQTRADLPDTTAALTLLATLAATEPELGRATIRDDEAGVIATYRPGDTIADGIRLIGVTPDAVALEVDGRSERLVFDLDPAAVEAGDVFYPDLAHFDDLPSSMADAVQLAAGPGYVVKRPSLAWGTPRTVQALRQALRDFRRMHPDAPEVHVGDLSKREGGPLPPHVSHQSGRDIDIGYVLQGALAHRTRFITATQRNLDPQRSFDLLRAFLDTGEVAYVFMNYEQQAMLYEHAQSQGVPTSELEEIFQYPRGRGAMQGIVRHWKGHDDHFHVRMRK